MPTPTIYFPDSVRWSWTMTPDRQWKTIVEESIAGGARQAMQLWPTAGRRTFTGTTKYATQAERKLLADFRNSIQGRTNPFYLFWPDTRAFTAYAIGTSTVGPGQVLGIPFKASVVSALYVNGVSKAFTQQFNIGTGGEDQVTITGAQTAALAVTIDVVGRERFAARSRQDSFPEGFLQSVPQIANTKFDCDEEF